MGDFSHLSKNFQAKMVDLSEKVPSLRKASVWGTVSISSNCIEKLNDKSINEIICTARLAGIQAAKQTHNIVPLCHQIFLDDIDIEIFLNKENLLFEIMTTVKTHSSTGSEMECMIGSTVVAVTIYDMIKAVNPEAILGPFKLVNKQGGKSGYWTRPEGI
ncbi:MAG: cyclic pyranopterin monophosphate synthase MoaC [Oligoflexales bacterium]|nr:cyclic pyranopterin monophosphate synthase MoaC [Oligoflexales bacterium]